MKNQIDVINVSYCLIVLILPCLFVFSTTIFTSNRLVQQHINQTCTSREEAMLQAIKDIEQGRTYILLHGLLDYDEKEYLEMQIAEKKYGFKYISMGCIGSGENVGLYEQIMSRAVNERAHKSMFRTFDIYTLTLMKWKKRS